MDNLNTDKKSVLESGLSLIDAVLTVSHDIVINGSFKGTLLSSANVCIEQNAQISGDIAAVNIEVKGTVRGSIYAKGTLKLLAGSTINGRVFYDTILIEAGGHLEGLSCQLRSGEFDKALSKNKSFRGIAFPSAPKSC